MERIILHADANAFYASVELAQNPELAPFPVAVGGSPASRHGIVLAKNPAAKACGVKTGMALWEARRLCPDIRFLEPRMQLYKAYSNYLNGIYADYSDLREPFGIDETWLDLTGCVRNRAEAAETARAICRRVKDELGITVSVGASFNKIFAKLGSDTAPPDSISEITPENYRDVVWPMPVRNLLFVGRNTARKLEALGIRTIGELACTDPELLRKRLGQMGHTLYISANGLDCSPVHAADIYTPPKSISNSTTTPRDLRNDEDVRVTLMALAESVGMRLRREGYMGMVVEVSVRGSADLTWSRKQLRLQRPTDVTTELFDIGFSLFRQLHRWPAPIRSLGLGCSDLCTADTPWQGDLFGDLDRAERRHTMDCTLDKLRSRFGFDVVQRGLATTAAGLETLKISESTLPHTHH